MAGKSPRNPSVGRTAGGAENASVAAKRRADEEAKERLSEVFGSRRTGANEALESAAAASRPSSEELLKSNPPDLIQRHLKRMGLPSEVSEKAERSLALESIGRPPEVNLERIIGKNMLLPYYYLEVGREAGRAVGKIVVESSTQSWMGTGFLISSGLLMTNNHVLPKESDAKDAVVQFGYEADRSGRIGDPVEFELDPDTFYLTDESLDYSLVAVRPLSKAGGKSLSDYGVQKIAGSDRHVLAGTCVSIIQHPNGEPKQVALRENEVVRLSSPAGDQFLYYRTDTMPGSSGSAVFDDTWQIVALHHAVADARDPNGDYIANEGIRIDAIVKNAKARNLPPAKRAILDPVFESPDVNGDDPVLDPVSHDDESTRKTSDAIPVQVGSGPTAQISLSLPLRVTISVSLDGAAGVSNAPLATPAETEAVTIDPNYSNRKGYSETFLGSGALAVPLPKLNSTQRQQAAVPAGASGPDAHVLKYHHYSVVLNGTRKLAQFTAVNIDGNKWKAVPRERDKWFFDPRISKDKQTGETVYTGTPFDRGHLVRRLDPTWADTMELAKVANDDTFHFTNCSPQHERFNQGKNLWAGLEDYVLNKAKDAKNKVSVFTGPVFRTTDKEFKGLKIPKEFWKVITYIKSGKLAALAFLVSQADLLKFMDDVEAASPIDVAKTFQTKVSKIAELTGLGFGSLVGLDGRVEAEAVDRELRSLDDVAV